MKREKQIFIIYHDYLFLKYVRLILEHISPVSGTYYTNIHYDIAIGHENLGVQVRRFKLCQT